MVNEGMEREEYGSGHVSENAAAEHRHVEEHTALYSGIWPHTRGSTRSNAKSGRA